jgi:hypothetical protein
VSGGLLAVFEEKEQIKFFVKGRTGAAQRLDGFFGEKVRNDVNNPWVSRMGPHGIEMSGKGEGRVDSKVQHPAAVRARTPPG